MRVGFIWMAVALSLSSAAFADNLSGQASIIDGDTIEIQRTRIRLWGIDAPESAQLCRGEDSLQYRCGAKAANELDTFIARRPVSCIPISLDQYRRTVATCRWTILISANGWSVMASQLTGLCIPRENSTRFNARRSTPAKAF